MKIYACHQLGDTIETWKLFETWEAAHEEYEAVSKFYTTYLIRQYDVMDLFSKLRSQIFDLKG